jgi:hypothetical protein
MLSAPMPAAPLLSSPCLPAFTFGSPLMRAGLARPSLAGLGGGWRWKCRTGRSGARGRQEGFNGPGVLTLFQSHLGSLSYLRYLHTAARKFNGMDGIDVHNPTGHGRLNHNDSSMVPYVVRATIHFPSGPNCSALGRRVNVPISPARRLRRG